MKLKLVKTNLTATVKIIRPPAILSMLAAARFLACRNFGLHVGQYLHGTELDHVYIDKRSGEAIPLDQEGADILWQKGCSLMETDEMFEGLEQEMRYFLKEMKSQKGYKAMSKGLLERDNIVVTKN